MKTVYVKKYIKTVDDLPKEDGFYFVNWTPGHAHHTTMSAQYYDESIKGLWFGKGWFDWYLIPVELPDEAVIVGEAMTYSSYPAMPDGHPEFEPSRAADFEAGVNWIINILQ